MRDGGTEVDRNSGWGSAVSLFGEPILGFGDHPFLSNFYPSIVTYEGEVYATVEHAYQAAKTLDLKERETIRKTFSPGKAKKLGKTVLIREDWEEIKVEVMYHLLQQKFSNPDLKEKLLATGEVYIEETNTWGDTFWGCCPQGKGKNMLGILLMAIRRDL